MFYTLWLDNSNPTFSVETDEDRGFIRNTADVEWWLFTNRSIAEVPGSPGSGNVPPIRVHVEDSPDGSRLVAQDSDDHFDSDHDDGENFALVEQEFERGVANRLLWNYDYQEGGSASHFSNNDAVWFDVDFWDEAGNEIDGSNPGFWVIMDVTDPEVLVDESTVQQQVGNSSPAVPGEPLRVNVNVTDIGGLDDDGDEVYTPPEFLKVEAQLFSYTGPIASNQWVELVFDEAESDDEEGHFFGNVSIPDEWATGNTSAFIRVTDVVGNTDTFVLDTNVSVKADLPRIAPIGPLGPNEDTLFTAEEDIEFRIRAWDPAHDGNWTEGDANAGTGIDFETVTLHYRIEEDGNQQNISMSATDTEDTFRVVRDFGELDPVYFYFSAADFAGNVVTYPGSGDPSATTIDGQRHLLLHTDRVGPEIEAAYDLTYIGGPGDYRVAFNVTDDPGIGVDDNEVILNWRLEGATSWEQVTLSEAEVEDPFTGATFNAYRGEIPEQDEDGTIIQYYVTADDLLGNRNNLGTPSNPQTTELDLTPPTVTVSAPTTSDENRFEVTWEGEDDKSGVRDYSLQFRIGDGNWLSVPDRQRTTLTSWEVCAATNVLYEFRVSARDFVGNERAFPEIADASTQVTAEESCVEPPEVFLNAPSDGATLSGDAEVAWSAISSVFGDAVTVKIEVSGVTVVDGLDHEGTYTWNTARYDANELDPLCFPDGPHPLRLVATDPAGMEADQEITVTLSNNRDSCEPQPSTTDNGFDLFEDFNPLYLLVVLAFIGLMAVFAVGMARRW